MAALAFSANFSASSSIFPTASMAAGSPVSSSSTSKIKGSPDSSGKLKISSPGVYVKSMRLQLSFIMLSSLPLNVGSFEALFQGAVDCHRMVGEHLVAVKPGGEAAAGGDGKARHADSPGKFVLCDGVCFRIARIFLKIGRASCRGGGESARAHGCNEQQ